MTWQVSHSCRLIVRLNDQAVTRRTPRSTISPESSNRYSNIRGLLCAASAPIGLKQKGDARKSIPHQQFHYNKTRRALSIRSLN
jgi:hypothetical protein